MATSPETLIVAIRFGKGCTDDPSWPSPPHSRYSFKGTKGEGTAPGAVTHLMASRRSDRGFVVAPSLLPRDSVFEYLTSRQQKQIEDYARIPRVPE